MLKKYQNVAFLFLYFDQICQGAVHNDNFSMWPSGVKKSLTRVNNMEPYVIKYVFQSKMCS